MGNMALSVANRAIGATFSGGSWQAGNPASNAGTRRLGQVARSTSASASHSVLQLDLGAAYYLRAFALVATNLTKGATLEVELGTSSGGGQVYNGSAVACWQLGAFDTAAAARGLADASTGLAAYSVLQLLPQLYSARYVTLKISDTGNPDGFVDVGLVWVGGLLVPAINPEYGQLTHGHVDRSTVAEAENGADWATPRPRARTAQFLLGALTAAEGEQVHEMQRLAGMVDDVLYIPDVDDAALQQRYGFVGRMREMRPVEYPNYADRAMGFSLIERMP